MKKKYWKFIVVDTQHNIVKIDVESIWFLVNCGKYAEVHLDNEGVATVSKNVSKCGILARFNYFYKIGSSYYVNMLKIQKYIKADRKLYFSDKVFIVIPEDSLDGFYKKLEELFNCL